MPALERTIYPSLGTLNKFVFNGLSNYNGLQSTLRKRFTHGLLFGVSYSWSRAMALLAFDPLVQNNYSRNYGPQSADRRQTFGLNYSYDFPKPGQALHNKVLSVVADGWQISGITTANTGAPLGFAFGTTNGLDITGSTKFFRDDKPAKLSTTQSPSRSSSRSSFAKSATHGWSSRTANAATAGLRVHSSLVLKPSS